MKDEWDTTPRDTFKAFFKGAAWLAALFVVANFIFWGGLIWFAVWLVKTYLLA